LSLLSKKRPDLILSGIDLSADSVRRARARSLNVALADIWSVREEFDAITLLDVAEHLPNPSTFFASCYHLLGEGGILYLHTPRICAWDRLLQRANFWMKTRLSIYHLQLWSDKALETALRNSGFTVLSTKAERELSWPIHKYVESYINGYIFYPALLCAHLLALTLKNKAIVTAIRKSPPDRGSYGISS
jgi:SAM-dependent methyltransferase